MPFPQNRTAVNNCTNKGGDYHNGFAIENSNRTLILLSNPTMYPHKSIFHITLQLNCHFFHFSETVHLFPSVLTLSAYYYKFSLKNERVHIQQIASLL